MHDSNVLSVDRDMQLKKFTKMSNIGFSICKIFHYTVSGQDACGHYCILFGVARSGGDTFQNIVKELSTLTRDNLVKFIVKTIL